MISGIINNANMIIPHGQTGDRVARVIFRGGYDNDDDDDDEDDDDSVASNWELDSQPSLRL